MRSRSDVLRQSFQEIERDGVGFVGAMYATLFRRYPEVAPLFANATMEEQWQKLLMALAFVIEHLESPERLGEVLRRLGRLHSHYDIRAEDYQKVGLALLETCAERLGPAWNEEHRAAWLDAYAQITAMMLDGYRADQAESPPD